jgi:hypothetical protein
MSYPAINTAIAKVIMETKCKVIDDLLNFLDTKLELDDDTKSMFEEFKKNIEDTDTKAIKAAAKGSKTSEAKEKKKRSPTLFNLFVKEKQSELKGLHPEENGKTIIGMASKMWKTDPFASFIKKHSEDIKKDHADSDNETIYSKLKEMYEENGDGDHVMNSDAEAPPKPSKPAAKKASKKSTKESDGEQSDAPKKGKKGAKKASKAKKDSDDSDNDSS